ncbi:MAG: glycosyltransferase [Proteobacteria bacterium]|nr:glycosyltransferase [Pseudomonadota bacterium]
MHSSSTQQRAKEARRQWQLGQTHAKAGRWDAAQRAHASAARLVPGDAVYALNHARSLFSNGLTLQAGDEALRSFRLDPTSRVACEFAAECLMRQHRHAEAVEVLRSLDAAVPRDPASHSLLGLALQRVGQPREAIAAFFDALALAPSNAVLHHNLGLCFSDLDMKTEAAQCFNTALLLGVPRHIELSSRGLACFYERSSCSWKESAEGLAGLAAATRSLPADASVATTPFAHAVLTDNRADQLAAARSCARYMAAEVEPLPKIVSDWQPGGRRLRIGYVSADFHQHATAILMAEMFEQHDRERFEVRIYSHGGSDGSKMRRRLEAACEGFADVRLKTDREIAQMARDDGIDLLIDLKGHTKDHRIAIFAYRAAPVQVSFLGYPGTTGADYIDYVIGDAIVTPLAHAEGYSEKIAQMPVCYQPNDRQRAFPEAPTRASQGLPEDALVLCGFNQPYKISPEVFDAWCRLLQALPDAVLWLLEWTQQALPNLKREAAARGIDPARLIGAPRATSADHIARFRLADMFLDTWPCNAHTTASDALWAGVPIVTLIGETFASRVAASLLHAVGTPELVCTDLAGYERTVLELAADAPRRAMLRERLMAARDTSPLFDSRRFTQDIEALYLRIAERHAQGLAPDHLPAA